MGKRKKRKNRKIEPMKILYVPDLEPFDDQPAGTENCSYLVTINGKVKIIN